MSEKRVLFIHRIIPYPIASGDTLILNYQMQAISKTQVDADLLFLKRSDEDLKLIDKVKNEFNFGEIFYAQAEPKINFRCIFDWVFRGRSYIFNRFYSKDFSEKVLELVFSDKYSTIIFENIFMYINIILNKKLKNEIDNRKIKIIVGVHVFESSVFEKFLNDNKNKLSFLRKRIIRTEIKFLKHYETLFMKLADKSFFVGFDDYKKAKENIPAYKSKFQLLEIIPFIEKYPYSSPDKESKNSIYYLGSYSWLPNVDAVKYFTKNIFPKILEKSPNTKFFIVGLRPPEEIKKLHNGKNIFFVGEVDNVFEEIQKYTVLVVPLRIGGGTRLKLLESIAWGKAIVTTSIGAEGINLHNENPIIIADQPDVFAQKVLELLENDSSRISLKETSREFALKYYKFDRFKDDMSEILSFRNE